MDEYKIEWPELISFNNLSELYEKQKDLPVTCSLIDKGGLDNVAKYHCYEYFNAEDFFDAKKYVKQKYKDLDVFDVYSIKEGPILEFTELDI